jgi:hypothetical protein
MSLILNVMIKSLVYPFYKQHLGILLFVYFVMFGIVESSQVLYYHQSLIYGMLTSPVFMGVIFLLWFFYHIKIIHFILRLLNQNEYLIINLLALLPRKTSFYYFSLVSLLSSLPILIYTLAIFIFGFNNQLYSSCLIIFFFLLILTAIVGVILTKHIYHKHLPSIISIPELPVKFPTGSLGIRLGYLINQEKIAIFLSKLFSIVLIYFVKETLETGDDFRIILITWLFALLSHTFLVIKLKSHEDHKLTWTRNLPISTQKILLSYLLLYSILLLPEMILLLGALGRGITLIQFPILFIFAGGFLTSIHVYLYKPNRNPEYFVHFIIVLFLGSFMLVLSKLIIPLSFILLLASLYYFGKYYYQYQPSVG